MSFKTVTLETAKLLKHAGFRQDTHFSHADWSVNEGSYQFDETSSFKCVGKEFLFAAPTTEELLEDLPVGSELWTGYYRHLAMWPHDSNNWQCAYVLPEGSGYFGWQEAKTLTEVLAQMWLWLKNEGLLK